MKIALLGYGKMGKEIEKIALKRGHEIVVIIDADAQHLFNSDAFKTAHVAIEFTAPAEAMKNYMHCFEHHIPVVSGTTGWLEQLPAMKDACKQGDQTFFYSSNFSLGVNIFFALNKKLAQMMNEFPHYEVKMQEVHHIHKLDAPSGTAITLAEEIIESLDRKQQWKLGLEGTENEISIEAIRENEVPGIHEVKYYSSVDEISIKHAANSRAGFALGAVMAAEYTANNKGFLSMEKMLNL